jgi:predicted dehydrogenase
MNNINRRSFVRQSLLAASSLALTPYLTGCKTTVHARTRGANEDIRVAVVGFNGQGKSHIASLQKIKGVRITALCDADRDVLAAQAKALSDKNEPVTTYNDVRKLLENKDIDAISTATPNHWHSLLTIWACQAGLDVYVEKPVSHNVWEGRRMIEAARKYKRIVQAGTQSRSSREGIKAAVDWVQAGNLGKIKVARALCYKRRDSIGRCTGPQPIPASVDYDVWCGPAAKLPLMRKRLHYDWHWVWNTGNGDLGNQGIHEMDVARWFLGVNELSPSVFSVGGRLGYIDDGETPNTLIIFHGYPAAPLIFEVRGLPSKSGSKDMDTYQGAQIGIVIECEGGHVTVPSYNAATAYDKSGQVIKAFKGSEGHHDNFIKAVRSRNHLDLNADILEGHLSSGLCHTGNISYRLGKSSTPEDIQDAIRSEPDALEACERAYEHLQANGVDFSASKPTLGAFLKMDPKSEKFTNNPQANSLLTREYRQPFVVPAKV